MKKSNVLDWTKVSVVAAGVHNLDWRPVNKSVIAKHLVPCEEIDEATHFRSNGVLFTVELSHGAFYKIQRLDGSEKSEATAGFIKYMNAELLREESKRSFTIGYDFGCNAKKAILPPKEINIYEPFTVTWTQPPEGMTVALLDDSEDDLVDSKTKTPKKPKDAECYMFECSMVDHPIMSDCLIKIGDNWFTGYFDEGYDEINNSIPEEIGTHGRGWVVMKRNGGGKYLGTTIPTAWFPLPKKVW